MANLTENEKMESFEQEFLKQKIEAEKKDKQLEIEENKTALVKTDLEVKMEQYESLKDQKTIHLQKRNVEKKANEMEILRTCLLVELKKKV